MVGKTHLVLGIGSVVLLAGSLTACGGSSGASSASSTATTSSAAGGTTSASAGAGGGGNFLQNSQVQACLKAAGISIPTQTGAGPTGSFPSGARPTGSFTGQRPTGVPSGIPSGAGGAGGGFGTESSEIQAALKACGITLSGGIGPGGGTAVPSAAPTS
jgi:hypothetical protein